MKIMYSRLRFTLSLDFAVHYWMASVCPSTFPHYPSPLSSWHWEADWYGRLQRFLCLLLSHWICPRGDHQWETGRRLDMQGPCGLAVSLEQRSRLLLGDPLHTAPGSGNHSFPGLFEPRDGIKAPCFQPQVLPSPSPVLSTHFYK